MDYGGRGGHGHGDRELVESLLAAWRGKGVAWERSRRVQGCSPSKELDRDGLVGEIDGVALFFVENREAGNWSSEEDERRSCAARRAWWWRGELVEAYL